MSGCNSLEKVTAAPHHLRNRQKALQSPWALKPPRLTSLDEARKGYPGLGTGFFLCGVRLVPDCGTTQAQFILLEAP